jgi:hypothetical protein
MIIGNEDIREFLLKKGFSSGAKCNGKVYVLCFEDDFIISCDLIEKKATAEFPDFKYNSVNRFSPKNKIINYKWNDDMLLDSIKHNIDMFFDKAISEYNKR